MSISYPWDPSLAALRARINAEDPLHRRVRRGLRALWDAGLQLEQAPTAPADLAPLVALRREAVRLATQAVPFPSLAEGADALLALNILIERGLDDVSPEETNRVLALGRDAHQRALTSLEATLVEAESLTRRWQLTVATFAVCIALSAAIGGVLVGKQFLPEDLAAGKPFTLSSKWADCHPDQNECGNYPTRIAFHTLPEASPWYQVDLGAPTTFSGATIVNRQDMAMPLALPLVLEASDDGKKFKELARRTESFVTWSPNFPAQTARYFRVRVDRTSTLHLEAVRVHP